MFAESEEKFLALQHTYDLLGQLYSYGPDESLAGYLQEIPALNRFLAEKSPAELAASHYHLFGLNVYPYESVFLDPARRLGGAVTERAAAFYSQAGFRFDSSSESPDHLGWEMRLLSYLCGQERAAVKAGTDPSEVRSLQRKFLSRHILVWLPAFVQAVRQQGQPFYTCVAEITLEVVLVHAADLGVGGQVWSPIRLPEKPFSLDGHETGLREIAAYLATPVYSGVFLSRDSITQLARLLHLPRGFGDRQQQLLNLFNAAVQYDQFPNVVRELQKIAAIWQEMWQGFSTQPGMTHIYGAWLTRLNQTQQALGEILASVKRHQPS